MIINGWPPKFLKHSIILCVDKWENIQENYFLKRHQLVSYGKVKLMYESKLKRSKGQEVIWYFSIKKSINLSVKCPLTSMLNSFPVNQVLPRSAIKEDLQNINQPLPSLPLIQDDFHLKMPLYLKTEACQREPNLKNRVDVQRFLLWIPELS